jgi:hypothetical protein
MEIQLKTNLIEQARYQNDLFFIFFIYLLNKQILPKSANKASHPVTDKNTPPKQFFIILLNKKRKENTYMIKSFSFFFN